MIQNGLTDVNLIDKAVWINNNGIEFGSEGADGGSVFFERNKIIVPTVRLKEFFEKETRIDCLKIDIEGAEVEVIEDCKNELNKVKYLYVEYHSWKQQLQQLDKLLQNLSDNGFRYSIHPIGENMLQPFIQNNPKNAMDIQLDIHAINERLN